MQVILDSNILFSALISNSITRRLILEYNNLFLFPLFVFEEAKEHQDELLAKSGLSKEEFDQLLNTLLKKVSVVSPEVLEPYRDEALILVKDIDVDDVLFVACALAYPESVLWSNDVKLKKQTKVRVLNTTEIQGLLRN